MDHVVQVEVVVEEVPVEVVVEEALVAVGVEDPQSDAEVAVRSEEAVVVVAVAVDLGPHDVAFVAVALLFDLKSAIPAMAALVIPTAMVMAIIPRVGLMWAILCLGLIPWIPTMRSSTTRNFMGTLVPSIPPHGVLLLDTS